MIGWSARRTVRGGGAGSTAQHALSPRVSGRRRLDMFEIDNVAGVSVTETIDMPCSIMFNC